LNRSFQPLEALHRPIGVATEMSCLFLGTWYFGTLGICR